MKTAKEWFSELPEPYGKFAIKNTTPSNLMCKYNTMAYALRGSFTWSKCKFPRFDNKDNSHDFWSHITKYYENKINSLPICPINPIITFIKTTNYVQF